MASCRQYQIQLILIKKYKDTVYNIWIKMCLRRPRPFLLKTPVNLNKNHVCIHFGMCASIGCCGRPCSSAGQLAQLRGGVRKQQILGRSRARAPARDWSTRQTKVAFRNRVLLRFLLAGFRSCEQQRTRELNAPTSVRAHIPICFCQIIAK